MSAVTALLPMKDIRYPYAGGRLVARSGYSSCWSLLMQQGIGLELCPETISPGGIRWSPRRVGGGVPRREPWPRQGHRSELDPKPGIREQPAPFPDTRFRGSGGFNTKQWAQPCLGTCASRTAPAAFPRLESDTASQNSRRFPRVPKVRSRSPGRRQWSPLP
jgi:hypothetical protein